MRHMCQPVPTSGEPGDARTVSRFRGAPAVAEYAPQATAFGARSLLGSYSRYAATQLGCAH
eukprot:3116140-Rhodomonas_salina.1